jgi:antitoxin component YwqK of YwqJK toxin-antitoxin module
VLKKLLNNQNPLVMKQIMLLSVLLLHIVVPGFSQKLSLTDLTNLCNKKSWVDINQTLLARGWSYYDSEKGNTTMYNTITWSYNKDYYSDKSKAWFYLFTYEGYPNKISYIVFNKESYSLIQNSISTAGFRLVNSEIEDNELISIYGNASFTLEISTSKKTHNDWSDLSLTAYSITIIKKTGIYDPDNGQKREYHYGDVVSAEYTLLDGKLHGRFQAYYSNGKLKKTGHFIKGIENGQFTEYDEFGNISSLYTMSNGELHGPIKIYYPNGKLKKTGNYFRDKEQGIFLEYNEYGEKEVEYTMFNDELQGSMKIFYSNGKIKQSGNYFKDQKHGKFTDYDEFGIKQAEYTMFNGELHGDMKIFHPNGKLRKSGYFQNGKEHGDFTEYDENGHKVAEYIMEDGKMNGLCKFYENETISTSTMYSNDSKNGQFIDYYYNDNGKLQFKEVGEYLDNEVNGKWSWFIVENGKDRLLSFENYSNGLLNGEFQQLQGDSLILGSYRNTKLHGEYKVYLDINRMLFGSILRTDISQLVLLCQGNYKDGLKSGYWENFDFTGSLISEGGFYQGKERGEWKYYYSSWSDDQGNTLPYSKQLFLIQNYSDGKLNGKSMRYSYLKEETYPCAEIDDGKSKLDTCKRFVYEKVFETAFLKNDKLNGPFELLDSIKSIIAKGYFENDQKEGEWVHRYSDKNSNDEIYYFYQKGSYKKGKKEGQWVEYSTEGIISQTFHYKGDKLHGEFITWRNSNKPREKKQFYDGKLTELITYDSLGISPVNKYEIFQEKITSYKCRKIEYRDGFSVSQEYWLRKNEEINHYLFEFFFIIYTNSEITDGTMGYRDGDFIVMNDNDLPIVTGKFYKKDMVGLWTHYFYDQGIKVESNYIYNEKISEKYLKLNGESFSGKFIYIDSEKGLQENIKIKNGQRNGKTIYTDIKTNKIIKKESYKRGKLK